MARNVEIKAKLRKRERTIGMVEKITEMPPEEIDQEDVFFLCDSGRLKLRIFSSSRGELIYYRRADESGPRTSYYSISRTNEPNILKEILGEAFGVRAIVKKKRLLYLSGRTRIHIDSVEGLGEFLELEAVLDEGEEESRGKRDVDKLIDDLGIIEGDLLSEAYVDLIEKKINR